MYKALCLFRDQYAHIIPVEEKLKGIVDFEYDENWVTEKIKDARPDIIIGINEFHPEVANCYELAKKMSIPTLTIQDGILEWRFMFENPMYDGDEVGVPMHFPVLADKYACISPYYAHIINCLGNQGRVEVTGMPKMDKLPILNYAPLPAANRKKRILIVTATKPWFKEEQKATALQLLLDLKAYFEAHEEYEPVWRVTKLLFKELDVKTTYNSKESKEIVEQIMSCDAVISMPSTAIIEAMRCGKPVAQIDYFNVPNMVHTTWKISGKYQIDEVIKDMLDPEPIKMWMQTSCHDLMCVADSESSSRVARLIVQMIDHSKQHPTINMPDFFMDPIFYAAKSPSLNPKVFYKQREVLQHNDETWLRGKLMRLELENNKLNARLKKVSLAGIIFSIYGKLMSKVIKFQKNG